MSKILDIYTNTIATIKIMMIILIIIVITHKILAVMIMVIIIMNEERNECEVMNIPNKFMGQRIIKMSKHIVNKEEK